MREYGVQLDLQTLDSEQILQMMAEKVKSEKNDSLSLTDLYQSLVFVVKKRPELSEQVLSVLAEEIKSEKNDAKSLRNAYDVLSDIIKKRLELSEQVLPILAGGVKSEKHDNKSLWRVYDILFDIIENRPELSEQTLPILAEGMKSGKNGAPTFLRAYCALSAIVKKRPELSEQVLPVLAEGIKSEDSDYQSLVYFYAKLPGIIEKRPDLSEQVLSIFVEGIKSEKNSRHSLYSAYEDLFDIIEKRPELSEQVLPILVEEIKSERNDSNSLGAAYKALSAIIKNRPELTEQVLPIFFDTIKSEKNDHSSLQKAYEILSDIITNRPKLSSDIFQMVLDSAHCFDKNKRIPLFAKCLKNCRVDDFTIPEDLQKEVSVAQKLRFSRDEEISYALENMSLEKIADYNFGTQQHSLNIIIGLAAVERGISADETKKFRAKTSEKMNDFYTQEKDWLVPASFSATEIFGSWLGNYMDKVKGHLSVHDALYWLPEGMSKQKNESFSTFLHNKIIFNEQGQKAARPLEELSIIARNWKSLKPEEEKLPYKDVLAICKSKKYDNQKYEQFAAQASKFGYPASDYSNIEAIYQASLMVPTPFETDKEFKFGKYTGKFLPREDPRVGFFGDYTNCCQHFGKAGDSCAVSSMMDPYSQLFVIEDEKGCIVAGSWVWENTEGKYREACFDNIEAIGEYKKNPLINKIYEHAAEYMCKEANCRRVTIGLGYQDAETSKYKKTEAIPLPKLYENKYSDARNQVLLQENPKAQPLDKTQESQRYVRDVCFLDLKKLAHISEQCFPEGDQALQAPENLAGKVLVDRDKGLVGYCLYDPEEKHIYDMAVLPEYRKDKNASSSKLFLEIGRDVTKLGGQWSLEARDKTSYRYLEIMEKRGMIKMDTKGIDHEMSDGSKVYDVSFNVIEPKQQTNQQMRPLSKDGLEK